MLLYVAEALYIIWGIYLFIPFIYLETQVRPVSRFSCLMAQTMWTHARKNHLGVSFILISFRGLNPPPHKKPNLGGMNRCFQVKMRNIKTYILSKPFMQG